MVGMKMEFLVATINRTNTDFLYNIFKNISTTDFYILVINQCINIPLPQKELSHFNKNVKIISTLEKGTSNSRNLAIENMRGDVGILTDDDVVYDSDTIDIILKAYSEFPQADLITFKSKYFSGKDMKNYKSLPFLNTKATLKNISDIEITFKKDSIISNNIRFNKLFGLGAKYPLGEYLTFLMDCLKNNCDIYYYPEYIVSHPDCLHSGLQFRADYEIGRGALFAKISLILFPLYNIYFTVKKYKLYKNKHSFFKQLHYLFKGSFLFIKQKQ